MRLGVLWSCGALDENETKQREELDVVFVKQTLDLCVVFLLGQALNVGEPSDDLVFGSQFVCRVERGSGVPGVLRKRSGRHGYTSCLSRLLEKR
jgi:hypothetical protein